jgi:CheY-like chemotaxis protein
VALKVLVVEDDAPTLELMDAVLTSLKVEVRAVSDSEQAAVLVNQERFDGIFVDLQMPKLDGFQLTRRIRASSWNKSSPIVVVTGNDNSKTMQKTFAAGTTFFLQKPIDRQRLTNLFKAARGRMFENRRQFVRLSLQTEVTCQVGHKTFRGTSSNISQGGILFEAGGSLFPGEMIRLSFRLPGSQLRIEVTGIVARIDEQQRAAARFTRIGSRELRLIRDLIGSDGDQGAETGNRRT